MLENTIDWNFSLMTDKELMEWLHFAQEFRDKKYLKMIKDEIRKRWIYE